MAVDYARIVLAEKDWIKYLLPCKPENKHVLKATDSLTFSLWDILDICIHFFSSLNSR